MIEHSGDAIGSNEAREVGFLGDFGVVFVGFEEGFDVGETARLCEALDGEVLGVARGGWRGGRVVIGEGGVDF